MKVSFIRGPVVIAAPLSTASFRALQLKIIYLPKGAYLGQNVQVPFNTIPSNVRGCCMKGLDLFWVAPEQLETTDLIQHGKLLLVTTISLR